MDLLERDDPLAVLGEGLDRCLDGVGRLVAVTGESGIGKSALVRAFAEENHDRARFLLTACDDLLSPRPLGPLHDLARGVGAPLTDLLANTPSPTHLFPAFAAELSGRLRPGVLVVEDLHWADDATLDWLSYLARRLAEIPVLLVLTYRDDDRAAVMDVGRVLAAAPRTHLDRVALEPLSQRAVATLAGPDDEWVDTLMRLTGGNPLLVEESVTAGSGHLPGTVRDSTLARLGALADPARHVVELASTVPGVLEWSTLEALVDDWVDHTESALGSGLLTEDDRGLRFRHELVRQAVEESLSAPRRRVLNTHVLQVLEAAEQPDPARLAHHARRAGLPDRVVVHASAAARAAAAAGAHRQAAQQYAAAVEHADLLAAEERAELFASYAEEARISNQVDDALAACRQAVRLWEELGHDDRRGAGLAAQARLHWAAGHRTEAEETARTAIEVLEPLGPSAALAATSSCLADILTAVGQWEEATTWSRRALDLATALDDSGTLAVALSDTGSGALFSDRSRGEELLDQAFALADDGGHRDVAGRAAATLAMGCLYHRRYDDAEGRLARALDYARDHELAAHEALVLGLRSRWNLDQGRWDQAERDARQMLGAGDQPGVSLCSALVTLGLLHARRGDPEATEVLDDAWERALHTGDLQRIAPTAAARAELAWLQDDPDGVVRAALPGFSLAQSVGEPWSTGELGWWLSVAGEPREIPTPVAEPFRLLLAGDWRAAADVWAERGLRYEQALALAQAQDPPPVFEALATVDELGADATGRLLRRQLRDLGVERVPRGPRASTRENPAGLTDRQVDVLDLLVDGLTNQQIADRLVLSVRTVDHHVSAILQKLGVANREVAAAWALETRPT